ncbi:MAG: cellulase family glycosylhydrolase [Verrucomicrobia bacterium]|nr:cellulase family glycosylhydrolase [Verrucomicrobiota bacterium]
MKFKTITPVLTLSYSCFASDLPPLVLPQGVGVNIHFTRGHEQDLDLIAAAGFKFIRMDFGWAGIERTSGVYDWSAYDELTANLEKRGLRALYILDYSNPRYEETVVSKNPVTGREQKDTASPQHPESVAAFARWAATAAKRYQGRRIVWEIWNEPNISFWKPKPNVEQYNALALATCKAIREADPNATIVAPATSGFPWEFLEGFFKCGVLEYLDAVSVHPYRNYSKAPESAAEDYQRLRGLIAHHAPSSAKRNMPILSGEWGYASHAKGVPLETQAAFIARQQLANLLSGVPLSIWYDWKNDGADPNEREHNFGTMTHDLKPKPAYLVLQTLTRELSGCRIVRRLKVGSEHDFVLLLTNSAGAQKLAAWTTGESHVVAVDAGVSASNQVTAVRGSGEKFEPKIEQSRLQIELTPLPAYFTIKGSNAVK